MDDPSAFWSPIIGEVFHIPPWRMVDVRPDQYEAMSRRVEQLSKAAKARTA